MTITILLIALGVLVVSLGYFLIMGPTGSVSTLSDLVKSSRPTDLEAFLNLVDPMEEHYLRSALDRRDFSRVQRARIMAAIVYVNCVRHNSAVFLALGNSLQNGADQRTVELGREIATVALRLRLTSSAAIVKLSLGYFVPAVNPSISNVIDYYRRATDNVSSLCQLQAHRDAVAVLAAL